MNKKTINGILNTLIVLGSIASVVQTIREIQKRSK